MVYKFKLLILLFLARLRDHDVTADKVISSAQSVLKEVEAMRQYQEDIDSLNSIAHNRPRAQLVLGKFRFFSTYYESVDLDSRSILLVSHVAFMHFCFSLLT